MVLDEMIWCLGASGGRKWRDRVWNYRWNETVHELIMAETGWGVYVVYYNVLPTFICWWTYLRGSCGDADIENSLVDAGREGERWTHWEGSTGACAWPYVKLDSQWEFAVWHRELRAGAPWWPRQVGWSGREALEGGDIRISMADLCWFMAETNTIL